MQVAELAALSNFTFLTGASHPEEIVRRAAELGLAAVAIADRNSVAGVVRAHSALKELRRVAEEAAEEAENASPPSRAPNVTTQDVWAHAKAQQERKQGKRNGTPAPHRAPRTPRARSDVRVAPSSRQALAPSPEAEDAPLLSLPRLIVASRLAFTDSPLEIVALPRDRAAWGRLCRLLTLGKRRTEKGSCDLALADLADWGEGMELLVLPPDPLAPQAQMAPRGAGAWLPQAERLARRFPGAVWLGLSPRYDGRDAQRLERLAGMAERAGLATVATADPILHRAGRRQLADVLSCIRLGTTIDNLGAAALANAERRMRGPEEFARIFAAHPQAVANTAEIARRCTFSLDELRYEYPDEVAHGEEPHARLTRLTEEGLARRYPDGVPERAREMVGRELELIGRLDYARYFLTVHDVVAFARSRGILCQGRGSAANSVVCYALGITEIGPETITMVFERFVSEARAEPPDIDVDFEHERREEVIQHIYETYGRHRAGLCATVIHFRSRAAIREVGKAMGLSTDVIAALAGQTWGWGSERIPTERLKEVGLDPADGRLMQTLRLVGEITGFPRHLSQHVGGFVMTRGRLDELVPIENAAMEGRTVIEWDKDDIDALGILKVDVLALGMLSCLRRSFDLLREHRGLDYTLATLPPEDPATYDMLCEADSVGVFQVESRAQMNFLPRMRPRCFYDLVIEVAIIRPGPIQGDMVHPYLRRRRGEEAVTFPSDALGRVLEKTLGVPLFQEQAMQIAIVGAGFSPTEADRLRRSLATFRRTGTISSFRERFIAGMLANGYAPDFAERCFSQIEGFGEYGFPESHAASFALLVYASAWLKKHHPAVFACALLNSQPMGFYAPAQIVRDAREHGVEVRPVCVNASFWDSTLEPDGNGGLALRLGFRQVKGIGAEEGQWIAAARANGYPDIESLWRRAGVGAGSLRRLAEADAFAAMGLARRDALWQAAGTDNAAPLPLFDGPDGDGRAEARVAFPEMTEPEAVISDYVSMRLTLRTHPVALLRGRLGSITAEALCGSAPNRRQAVVSGLVITRQRPGTASGVIFLTLEDETGSANVVVWNAVYEQFRRAVIAGRLLRVTGEVQREGGVTHLIARRIEDLSGLLDGLGSGAGGRVETAATRADEARRPVPVQQPARAPVSRPRHPREQAKVLFPSRDFH